MPPNITPPLVLRYGATDVPIIQLSLSSNSLAGYQAERSWPEHHPARSGRRSGRAVPYPYGGKPRVIMVDLDQQALQARGLSPADVSDALQHQNVILPAGDVKMGTQGLHRDDEQQPRRHRRRSTIFPIKEVDGKTVFMRDVAHVHDGYQVQTNSVSVNGRPAR